MHEFVEAFRFIARDGTVPGAPGLPSLAHLTLETLKVGAIGVAISLAIAVPLGVWLGHIHRGSFVAINLGNIGRALPSLAVLAIGDAFLGLGLTVVELALVILAVPPIITNAYLGVDEVDRDLVDAARGMGMSEREILPRRAAAGGAADVRRHPHGGAVRGQHDHDRLAGRLQRQPGRRDRQRDELPLLRRAGRRDLRRGAGAAVEGRWRSCSGSHAARPARRADGPRLDGRGRDGYGDGLVPIFSHQ